MAMNIESTVSASRKMFAVGISLAASMATAGTTFLYQQEYIDSIAPYMYNDPGQAVLGTSILTFNVGNTNQIPAWEVGDFTGVYNSGAVKANRERTVSAGWNGSIAIQVSGYKFGAQLHTYSAPLASAHQPQLKTINFQHAFDQDIRPWSDAQGPNPRLCMGVTSTVPSNWTGDGSNNQTGVTYLLSDARMPGSRIAVGALIFDNKNATDQTFVDLATGWAVGATYFGGDRYITTSDGSATFTTSKFSDERWFGFCMTKQNIVNFYNDFTSKPSYNGSLPPLDFNYLRLDTIVAGGEISIGSNLDKNGHMAFTYTGLTSHIMTD